MKTKLHRQTAQSRAVRYALTEFSSVRGFDPKPPTAKDIEEIQHQARQEAWQQGFAEGQKKGEQRAWQETRELLQQKIDCLTSIANHLLNPLHEVNRETTDTITQLAISIAEQLVQSSLELNPELVLEIVRSSMSLLPPGVTEPVISLHPLDAEIVGRELSGLLERHACQIREDPRLARGDCLFHSHYSEIDACMQSKIRSLTANLLDRNSTRSRDSLD